LGRWLRPTLGLVSRSGIVPLSHSQDIGGPLARTVRDLAIALDATPAPRLLDLRTREEHEAVVLPGAELFSNDLLQSLFATEPKDRLSVLDDHTGDRSLDACAYLVGHGFKNARALRGGIDAYAKETDPSLPRYQLEFED
jgi:rhodanese-related sulfurtransferase